MSYVSQRFGVSYHRVTSGGNRRQRTSPERYPVQRGRFRRPLFDSLNEQKMRSPHVQYAPKQTRYAYGGATLEIR